MAKPPDSTKLAERARERWPQLTAITVRHHGEFAYVAGQLPDGTTLPLMRLHYTGSAAHWGFAIYRASHDDYDKSVLPTGLPFGTPPEALDCACGLYLGDATAWLDPPSPTNLQARPLDMSSATPVTANRRALDTCRGESVSQDQRSGLRVRTL
jgi:hypothetical protein